MYRGYKPLAFRQAHRCSSVSSRMFASKFYVNCQHFKIKIFCCANLDIYHSEFVTVWPFGACIPTGSSGCLSSWACPLLTSSLCLQPQASSYLQTRVPQWSAQHLMRTINTVESNLTCKPASLQPFHLPVGSWQLYPGGKNRGLILDSPFSLKLNFRLVSTLSHLVPPNVSRI